MDVVVVGGGIGGLVTALALGRGGHEVVLLERDEDPTPVDASAAWEWRRAGAPQLRHSHMYPARLRTTFRDRFPDVLDALRAAGALEIKPLARDEVSKAAAADLDPDGRYATLLGGDDDDLTSLALRRSTLEMVLRQVIDREPSVSLRTGAPVVGLLSAEGAAPVPAVTGVRLGDSAELRADAVVASTGRRSAVPEWLRALAVNVEGETRDTGLVYYSRFYQSPQGEQPEHRLVARSAGSVSYTTFPGDNGTFSLTVAIDAEDAELRTALRDPDRFERICDRLPKFGSPVVRGWGRPISPVNVMTAMINRLVHYTDGSGQPLVSGFHAVGDAHTCTNPAYGRGCTLAAVQAVLLADAFAAHPADALARAAAYEQASAVEVEPWYHVALESDVAFKAVMRKQAGRAPADPDPAPSGDRSSAGFSPALLSFAGRDPILARPFLRVMSLLAPPSTLQDPAFIARVVELSSAARPASKKPSVRVTRDDLLEAAA